MNSSTEHIQVTFRDISGEDWPRDEREFPPIRLSRDHVVLYKLSKGSWEGPPEPYKRQEDKWDDYHVRMPHSNRNEYDKETIFRYKTESRWVLIKKSLEKMLGMKTIDSKALIGAILKYNAKFKDVWKFEALKHYLDLHLSKTDREDFFKHTLPGIVKLAFQLPDLVQAPIPVLKQNQSKSLSLSQEQIASLLANAFLCTFPRRNTAYCNTVAAKLPKINFASLYESPEESVNQKLRCICNYFRRVSSKAPTGVVTFSRRFVDRFNCPSWETSVDPIESVPVYVDSRRNIEDATGLIQVDFANKFIGGGVLGSGLVQEEIRFLMCPELMAAMIFTESLGSQEALMIIGCERYNDYKGYGHESFRWRGDHGDTTPVDSSGRRLCAVLAIDAEQYWDQCEQFKKSKIERELNKAWIGFSFFKDKSKPNHLLYPGVATGNWGCGVFNGAPQLKCLIQMMAAVKARRPLAYYTFGDQQCKREVETAYDLCRRFDVTVGELFKCIIEYDYEKDLHSFLKDKLDEKLTQYRSAGKTIKSGNEKQHSQVNYSPPLIDFDSQNAGTSTIDDNCSQNVATETRQGYHQNISQAHNQDDLMRDHHRRPQSYHQDEQMRDHQNTYQAEYKDEQMRDNHNRPQAYHQGDQMRDRHNTRADYQMKYHHNRPQAHHQDDQIRDHHNTNQADYKDEQMRDKHNRTQAHHQGDQMRDHHNTEADYQMKYHLKRPQADYKDEQMRDKHNRPQAHHQGDQMRDHHNTQADYQMKYHHNRPQADYKNEQMRDKHNRPQAQHQGDQMRDHHNTQADYKDEQMRDHHNTQADYQMKYYHNRSQADHQDEQMRDDNQPATYSHNPPSNVPCSSQNIRNDTKHTTSNFQPSKNCGRLSGNCGRSGDSSQNVSSHRNRSGPSRSWTTTNDDTRRKPNYPARGGYKDGIGNFTRGFTQMTRPGVLFSAVTKGTAQWERQNSTKIYEATNNMEAVLMRPSGDGSSGPYSASDENVKLTAELHLRLSITD